MWWCLSSLDRRVYVETGIELTGANRCKAEVLRDLWSSLAGGSQKGEESKPHTNPKSLYQQSETSKANYA
jgi:hypothetical protein